jgi:signal transduction histidine kinase
LHDLLKHAVGQTRISGLMNVLREISCDTDSFGCILWQIAKPFRLEPPEGHLFVLADWFPDDRFCANHDLSIAKSKSGLGIRTRRQVNVKNVSQEIAEPDRFLIEAGITSFCTTPIEFLDGELGSLNLYRRANHRPYNTRELARVKELAQSVPMLYSIVRDKVGFTLLTKIDTIAQFFDKPIPVGIDPIEHVQAPMEQICGEISDAFHCLETSIFLEDRLSAPGEFTLAGTTWPGEFERQTYRADETDGITGWSLAHPDTLVRIFDLATFDPAAPDTPYQRMTWKDSLKTRTNVRRYIEMPDGEQLPPLSMMTAPIRRSDSLLGLIRCSVARGPVYFAESDQMILRMVASRVGSIWGGLLDRNQEMEEEAKALETLVQKIGELNGRTYDEARKEKPEKGRILEEVLTVASTVIAGASINDIRLLSDKKLKFAVIQGEAWDQGSPEEMEQRKTREFPTDRDDAPSAGAHVIETGEVYVIQDVSKDPFYSKTFPNAKKMIVAPLMLGVAGKSPEMFGVLDFRSTSDRDFPRYARYIAGLLGTQVALYLKLSAVIRELRQMHDVQIRVNEDMDHQFKSPIVIAHARVQEALKTIRDDAVIDKLAAIEEKLLIVRGACARAMHVSQNSRLFAQLAKGEKPAVVKARLTKDELISMLINTGTDAAMLHDQEQKGEKKPATEFETKSRPSPSMWGRKPEPRGKQPLRYSVNKETLVKIDSVIVDKKLFEQVITQVLDNAFKYSFPHTTVEVTGGKIEKGEKVRISIINEGIPIDARDVQHCIERGWQSEGAQPFSQGGSGIGLWIVHNIMEAMGAELIIVPTTKDYKTEMQLILPAK